MTYKWENKQTNRKTSTSMTQVAKEIQSKRWHCYLRPKSNFTENVFLSCLMYRLSLLNYTNLQVLSTCQCRTVRRLRFNPWVRKIPWRREQQPTLVFLPGKSNRQRSLAEYSPESHKESDMP